MIDLALRIGGVGTRLRRNRPSSDASVARVEVAVQVAIAITARATRRITPLTGDAIAYLTTLASGILTVGLTALTLSILPLLLA